MSILEVPARDLLRVLPFRSTDDVRYYLNGILVEPAETGCMIVATNGHWLAAIHSEGAKVDERRILVMSEPFEKALRETSEFDNSKVTVEDVASRAVLTATFGERYIEPGAPFIDGKFPQWRKVVPPIHHMKPGLIAALQSKYISSLHEAAGRDRYSGLKFWHDERDPEKSQVIARYSGCPELIVVIMPLREFNAKSCEWPTWFAPAPEETTEAAA